MHRRTNGSRLAPAPREGPQRHRQQCARCVLFVAAVALPRPVLPVAAAEATVPSLRADSIGEAERLTRLADQREETASNGSRQSLCGWAQSAKTPAAVIASVVRAQLGCAEGRLPRVSSRDPSRRRSRDVHCIGRHRERRRCLQPTLQKRTRWLRSSRGHQRGEGACGRGTDCSRREGRANLAHKASIRGAEVSPAEALPSASVSERPWTMSASDGRIR